MWKLLAGVIAGEMYVFEICNIIVNSWWWFEPKSNFPQYGRLFCVNRNIGSHGPDNSSVGES